VRPAAVGRRQAGMEMAMEMEMEMEMEMATP
jgi:hypothetical protein